MTVRVNKDSFNLREKLSELERPIGLKGSELMSADTAQEARDLVSAGRKNLIINGDMIIHQRSANLTLPGYIADRWRFNTTSLDQWAGNITWESDAPNGFRRSIKINTTTAETNFASGEELSFEYRIEAQNLRHLGWGTARAKPVTLSFWVKCNKTGIQSIHVRSHDASDGYSAPYSINAADTWEYKTIVIPGNTSGSINNDNGIGIWIRWVAADGDTAVLENAWDTVNYGPYSVSDAMDFGTTIGDYLQIAGVQLEVGKNATDFEYRSYGEELALCQRYYERFSADCGNGGFATLMIASKNNNTLIVGQPIFRVPKRAVGATFSHGGNLRMHNSATGSDITISSVQNSQLSTHGGYIVLVISNNTMSNGEGFRLEGRNDTSAFIAFASEL